MKKLALAISAATFAITATPALADPPAHAPAHGKRAKDAIYDSRGYYITPRRISRDSHIWRGNDGRYYCRRDNGTTGLLIGAGVGALAGHELSGRGDKTLGVVLGAALGGALGRAIDRGDLQCR